MKTPEHSPTSRIPHCAVLLSKSCFVMMDWDTQSHDVTPHVWCHNISHSGCTMVHDTAWWCTTQVTGAQGSPVLTRWCTRWSHKPTHTHMHMGPILLPRLLTREVKSMHFNFVIAITGLVYNHGERNLPPVFMLNVNHIICSLLGIALAISCLN